MNQSEIERQIKRGPQCGMNNFGINWAIRPFRHAASLISGQFNLFHFWSELNLLIEDIQSLNEIPEMNLN